MEDLKIFKNKEFGEIRIVEQNGEPWFVAADVTKHWGMLMGATRCLSMSMENHYLGIRGDYYNKPTQRATELNIFEIKNTVRTDYYGNVIPCPVVKINAKGQQYFIEKFLGMKNSPTPNPLSLIGIRG